MQNPLSPIYGIILTLINLWLLDLTIFAQIQESTFDEKHRAQRELAFTSWIDCTESYDELYRHEIDGPITIAFEESGGHQFRLIRLEGGPAQGGRNVDFSLTEMELLEKQTVCEDLDQKILFLRRNPMNPEGDSYHAVWIDNNLYRQAVRQLNTLGISSASIGPSTGAVSNVPSKTVVIHREWKDNLGRTMYASVEGFENDQVQFLKADGTQFSYPIDKLSENDRNYLIAQGIFPKKPTVKSLPRNNSFSNWLDYHNYEIHFLKFQTDDISALYEEANGLGEMRGLFVSAVDGSLLRAWHEDEVTIRRADLDYRGRGYTILTASLCPTEGKYCVVWITSADYKKAVSTLRKHGITPATIGEQIVPSSYEPIGPVIHELTPKVATVKPNSGDTITIRGGFQTDANNIQFWAEPVLVVSQMTSAALGGTGPQRVVFPTDAYQIMEEVPRLPSNTEVTYTAHFLYIYPSGASPLFPSQKVGDYWLIFHGRSDSTFLPPVMLKSDWTRIATRLEEICPGNRAYRIDWSTIAQKELLNLSMPYFPQLASALQRALKSVSITGTPNIVAHSWGTYFGYEFAKLQNDSKVSWFIALDPAAGALKYDYSKVAFREVSLRSWAILGTTPAIIRYGSNTIAATAHESYILTGPKFPSFFSPDAGSAHSAPVAFFAECLENYNPKMKQSDSLFNYFTPITPVDSVGIEQHDVVNVVQNRWSYLRSPREDVSGPSDQVVHEGYVEFPVNSDGTNPIHLKIEEKIEELGNNDKIHSVKTIYP